MSRWALPGQRARKATAEAALDRLRSAARSPEDPESTVMDFHAAMAVSSTRARAQPLAPVLARALRRRGLLERAWDVASTAMRSATGPDLRTLLSVELLATQLDGGEIPEAGRLAATCTDVMTMADRALQAANPARVAQLLRACLDLLLHRAIHCDDLLSPFAEDPADFLRPLRESLTYRRLMGDPRDGVRDPQGAAEGRAHRLLFVTSGNWHFLEPVLQRYDHREDVEVRRLDLSAPAEGESFPDLPTMTLRRVAGLLPDLPPAAGTADTLVPAAAAPLLAWADTVFVDWCDHAAVWASLVAPEGTRLVIRLHRMEALSVHPHLVDWSRVDTLVTVSAAYDRLVRAVVPGTATAQRHVLHNAMRLSGLGSTKSSRADRTLGMVGWGSPTKDPLFALDILAELLRHDPAWRLHLIGSDFPQALRPRGRMYRASFEERLRGEPQLAAAVVRTGHRSDLAVVLQDVGFILSTSLSEGQQVGLTEGIGSGAVPVVRDWPLTARYGGVATLFPDDWIVTDPPSAVARILALADPVARAQAGAVARAAVLDRYDWQATAPLFDQLLLPAR